MNRRRFLKTAAALPILPICGLGVVSPPASAAADLATPLLARRVRPTDAAWPSAASWERLKQRLSGRLIQLQSPFAGCAKDPGGEACAELFRRLRNPYYIGDEPALTENSGWVDAWTSQPSVYAVAAATTDDVVAAVNFARENNLRLVVKGGGHSYQGTSNAADSLLVWTRAMDRIELHDAFVGQGCAGKQAPQPAVSVGAGTIWMRAYDAVTNKGGRYVQGGGCTTVGVAGLIQSGGFGSFSKNYGLAAAGLLEAEVVTADGTVRIANACTHPDLFWGLKGGGGGSLGVITRLTLRTRELPEYFGGVFGTIRATSEDAFRRLTARVVSFYHEHLFNRQWGEQIGFETGNAVRISLVFQGLDRRQTEEIWRPFLDWVAAAPQDFVSEKPVQILEISARHFWDVDHLKAKLPSAVVVDDRPGARASDFCWEGDRGQAAQILHAYKSTWLPASLLRPNQQARLVNALVAASRHWYVGLHFNKGLAGAPADEIKAAKDTAMNPAVLDAFALAIIASGESLRYPGVPGHEPDVAAARRHADAVGKAMAELRKVSAKRGSYVSESDFFETSWQESFWGSNYARLAKVKRKYDPTGLFFVHHGVGSEEWSEDGFTREAPAKG